MYTLPNFFFHQNVDANSLCSRCLNSDTTSTNFTKTLPCYTPPPGPPHFLSPRRSSSASDESASSVGDYYTAMTTPTQSQHKLSPLFHSEHDSPIIATDFAQPAPVASGHHETHYTSSSDYHVPSRRTQSFDGKRYPTNVYAPHTPAYGQHNYEPYHPYQRTRAYTLPTGYSDDAHYPPPPPSYYSPTLPAPHSPPVFRGYNNTRHFSTPPTQQDRREAHIRSEQKRRESINGGFTDLASRLTSEQLHQALALSCYHSSDVDSDSPKVVFDTGSILGGERKNSKAVLLQKAVKAIDWLSKYAIEVHAENARLQRGKAQPNKNSRHVKRGSKDTIVQIGEFDLILEDDLKEEDGCS